MVAIVTELRKLGAEVPPPSSLLQQQSRSQSPHRNLSCLRFGFGCMSTALPDSFVQQRQNGHFSFHCSAPLAPSLSVLFLSWWGHCLPSCLWLGVCPLRDSALAHRRASLASVSLSSTGDQRPVLTASPHLPAAAAQVEEYRDYCVITPPAEVKPGVAIDTYDDHRMAMAFSLVSCTGVPVVINDPGCTRKTFPEYFQYFDRVATH